MECVRALILTDVAEMLLLVERSEYVQLAQDRGLRLGRVRRVLNVCRAARDVVVPEVRESGSCTGVELDVKESGRPWKTVSMRYPAAKLE